MNTMKLTWSKYVLALCLSAEMGCQTHRDTAAEVSSAPNWRNLFAGDPEIAGVYVASSNERDIFLEYRMTGRAAICNYYIWDGRIRLMHYDTWGKTHGGLLGETSIDDRQSSLMFLRFWAG